MPQKKATKSRGMLVETTHNSATATEKAQQETENDG
jgi:hypothetical protein